MNAELRKFLATNDLREKAVKVDKPRTLNFEPFIWDTPTIIHIAMGITTILI